MEERKAVTSQRPAIGVAVSPYLLVGLLMVLFMKEHVDLDFLTNYIVGR